MRTGARQVRRRRNRAEFFDDHGQFLELAEAFASVRVGLEEAIELGAIVCAQLAVERGMEQFVVGVGRGAHRCIHPASSVASCCRALCSRDFTVFAGTPIASLISS